MRYRIFITLLMLSASVSANPYDGQISMFEDGVEVTKTYHQMLKEQSLVGLTPLAAQVHTGALDLYNNPSSNILKKKYLASFPRDFESFIEIFHPSNFGQLYDGFIYIKLLHALAAEYPDIVGEIYLSLASEACLTADDPNYLRRNLINFETTHQSIYMRNFKMLTPAQQENVVLFKGASLHEGGKGTCNF